MKLTNIQEARYSSQPTYIVKAVDFDGRSMGITGPFTSKEEAQKFMDAMIQQCIRIFAKNGEEYGKTSALNFEIETLPTPDDFADDVIATLDDDWFA